MELTYRAGIVGATGMVGQRLVTLLENHPWFRIAAVAASKSSSGKTYAQAVEGRWAMPSPPPEQIAALTVLDASDVGAIASSCDFLFCAINLNKEDTLALEESYARAGIPVISNNKAARMLPDVPMIIPELNPHHAPVIERQRRRLGTRTGFIAVKPNCSVQCYAPALHPLMEFRPEKVFVSTYQAISGGGKTFASYPDILDNIIPYIPDEEEKSEREPLKIWGDLTAEGIKPAEAPVISAQCVRVPVSDGHLATVSVKFTNKPSMKDIIERWRAFEPLPQRWNLPSAPKPFLQYMEEPDRPQTKLDRDFGQGMGVSVGRLREDAIFDYRFVALSHNTIRGAAGGGVLTAELLAREGYITKK
ncbi:MAG: aspartate-semialdehyde dehydrogenase [Oscillospiraceae bacterium]|jgi:aspartate-semialdehyde dehydrogenase|nr:aspartate-semialdehyde dehydrogenase [Oscillospiraceae bacterium]